MKKRIFVLLLTAVLILGMLPAGVSADSTPVISAGQYESRPNWGVYVDITATGLEQLASLELEVYYDSQALELQSVEMDYMLSGALNSTNTATAGVVKLTTASLEGISGDGTLMRIWFNVKGDCAPGTYPIRVVVGEAYDVSTAGMQISAGNGAVKVLEATEERTFYLDSYWSESSTGKKGDTLTLMICNSWWQNIAAGAFTVEYDAELLTVTDVTLNPEMANGAVFAANYDTPGLVKITYATNEWVSSYNMFHVNFKIIGNADTQTWLTLSCKDVYDQSREGYSPNSTTTVAHLQKQTEVVDAPNLWMELVQGGNLTVGTQFTTTLQLAAGSNLAAADFKIGYDPAVLKCVSVTANETATQQGGMVVINPNYSQGQVKFSYVNTDGTSQALPLLNTVWEVLKAPNTHTLLTLSGSGETDADYQDVALDYIPFTRCVYGKKVIGPTCTAAGYTQYSCKVCGDSYKTDFVSTSGHTWVDADCASPKTCSVCSTTEGEPLDHNYTDGACQYCGRPSNGWFKENGKWCYNEDGQKVTSKWVKDSTGWCYLDENGHMVYNKWVKDSKGWCYVDESGYMVYNKWVKDSKGWCYVDDSGYMVYNKWVKDSKGWCYVDKSGYMVYNQWVKDSKGWCYVDKSGYMVYNKWVKDSVGWCYVDDSGYMVYNQWVKDSKGWCYVDDSGYMVYNQWVKDSKGWCYVDKSGYMVYNQWVKDSKGWCYVDKSGYMVYDKWIKDGGEWYYIGSDGYMVTNGWAKDGTKWCFMDENGHMLKDIWLNDGGKLYYLDANGHMVTGTKVIDGKTYKFSSSGVLIS